MEALLGVEYGLCRQRYLDTQRETTSYYLLSASNMQRGMYAARSYRAHSLESIDPSQNNNRAQPGRFETAHGRTETGIIDAKPTHRVGSNDVVTSLRRGQHCEISYCCTHKRATVGLLLQLNGDNILFEGVELLPLLRWKCYRISGLSLVVQGLLCARYHCRSGTYRYDSTKYDCFCFIKVI